MLTVSVGRWGGVLDPVSQCRSGDQSVDPLLFVFSQATGNFFSLFIGHSYQTKLFPEGTPEMAVLCLPLAQVSWSK